MHKATLYEGNNSMQQVDVAKTLSEYIDKFSWNNNEAVLDVGCGPGDVTARLLLPNMPSNVIKLVGMDVSPNMIKHAKNHHTSPKLEFVIGNIADKTIEKTLTTNKFNKIFSFYCLHWVQDQKSAFTNLFNLLNPGGEMLVMLNAFNPIYPLYERLSKSPKWETYTQDVARFISPYCHSKDPILEMNTLLKQTGFIIETCEMSTKTYGYRNKSYLRQALAAVSPFLERIPENLQEPFLNDCVDIVFSGTLPETYAMENDSVNFNYNLITIFARR